ncbi:hypothetical protein [Heyndrickxia sporothermodurans]|uniref:Uncharacterized protein n=1 Tax=Heyndrickxia sporothermodurans TaxID=46224 RepID=A0A150KPG4_9BACI|nr:hypothetical protein [Heyndrickxia sporothermodurans]KYD00099.1 hypothetical protein B4102_1111 [Heyndrickxia sporothermodurans]PTY79707.1 hypothetical protein B5V89_03890 [Heyndrickxia sporothermodurans]
MKKYYVLVSILSIALFCSSQNILTVSAHNHTQVEARHIHLHISDQEINNLMKKGYTKQDIFKAYFIAKHAKEKLDAETILKVYKQKQSWEETAKYFNVDIEKIKKAHFEKHKQFYEKNKTKIIQYLATYTGKSPTELDKYLKDVDLHFLIVAAAISKKSNTDLSQIIKDKKEGKQLKEIISKEKLDPKSVFDEAKNIHKGIHRVIEK